jgi:IS30 family transposase
MAKRYTEEEWKTIEQLYNEGFSNYEIGMAIGRPEGSIPVQIRLNRIHLNLIDRKEARRLRKLREASAVDRVSEIVMIKPKTAPVRHKQSIWDRMIGFFG